MQDDMEENGKFIGVKLKNALVVELPLCSPAEYR